MSRVREKGGRGVKAPLYRKVNTRARNTWHHKGADYAWSRGSKANAERAPDAVKMKRGELRGLDYTPLFRFLLSKVGEPFDEVYQEARARLDKEEPIYWMVARRPGEERDLFHVGEGSYWSGLKVDDEGLLALVDDTIRLEELWPSCGCCTHAFNGRPFVNRWEWGYYGIRRRPDDPHDGVA